MFTESQAQIHVRTQLWKLLCIEPADAIEQRFANHQTGIGNGAATLINQQTVHVPGRINLFTSKCRCRCALQAEDQPGIGNLTVAGDGFRPDNSHFLTQRMVQQLTKPLPLKNGGEGT
ncbi:hypothetical protein SRM1_01550 [Pseudomonas fluorescens]|nr:hypothetical protein SRM1_01550 [Pseudomonas fluorescens]